MSGFGGAGPMFRSAAVDRNLPVLAAVLWLASLVALYSILGRFFAGGHGWFGGWTGPSGAPDPAAGCPYPFCGVWISR